MEQPSVLMFVQVTFSIKPILAQWQTNELDEMWSSRIQSGGRKCSVEGSTLEHDRYKS